MKKDCPQLVQGNTGGQIQGNGRNQNRQGNGGGRGQGFQQQRQFVQPAQGAVNVAFYAEPVVYQHPQALVPAVAPQPGAQGQMFAAVQGAQNQGALIEGTFLVNGSLA